MRVNINELLERYKNGNHDESIAAKNKIINLFNIQQEAKNEFEDLLCALEDEVLKMRVYGGTSNRLAVSSINEIHNRLLNFFGISGCSKF